jgi:exosortase O
MGLAMNALLLILWMWLFRSIYPYLGTIFSRQEFRTNQILLVGVLILIGIQMRQSGLRPRLHEKPHLYLPALMLVLFSTTSYVLVERFLDINTLSASLFGLATYGLLGLWLTPSRWRQGLPAALLLIGTLPIGEHMQTFVGYPVRIFSATLVRDALSALGVQSISLDTILIFENGISQVDLPCSGIQSLWTGAMFLIAVTWIEHRPINLHWLAVALIFALLLLGANIARVGVLVAIGQVAGWRVLAEMLHVPLGVLGFIGACTGFLLLIRVTRRRGSISSQISERELAYQTTPPMALSDLSRPVWLRPVLLGSVLVLGLLYQPRPPEAVPSAPQSWHFPTDMLVEPWSLSPDEAKWLSDAGDSKATRWRFEWRDLTGTLLFVSSTSWRAQHRPERCFEVYGLSTENSHTYLLTADFPIRTLTLKSGNDQPLHSAAYWFQSEDRVTDDYGSRMWADLDPDRQFWILITVLFDGPYDPSDANNLMFYTTLRQAVARSLEGE